MKTQIFSIMFVGMFAMTFAPSASADPFEEANERVCDHQEGVGVEEADSCDVKCVSGTEFYSKVVVSDADDDKTWTAQTSIHCGDASTAETCTKSGDDSCQTETETALVQSTGRCHGHVSMAWWEVYSMDLICSVTDPGDGPECGPQNPLACIETSFGSIGLIELLEDPDVEDVCQLLDVEDLPESSSLAVGAIRGQPDGSVHARAIYVVDGNCINASPGYALTSDAVSMYL